MANWDSTKDEDSDLTAEQWNEHVADQKSRVKIEVQENEPDLGVMGSQWAKPSVDKSSIISEEVNKYDISGSDTPIVYDQTRNLIYTNRGSNDIVALNPNDFSLSWELVDATQSGTLNYHQPSDLIVKGSVGGLIDLEDIAAIDPETQDIVWELDPNYDPNFSDVLSRGFNDYIIFVDDDGDIIQLDITDGSETASDTHTEGDAYSMAADNDELDMFMIIGNIDGSVSMYDARFISHEWTEQIHSDRVDAVDLNRRIVATGSWDESIRLFDVDSPEEPIWKHSQHTDRVMGIKIGENYVYSTDRNGTVLVTDKNSGTVVGEVDTDESIAGNVEFSDESLFVATSNDDWLNMYDFEEAIDLFVSDGQNWIRVN